MESCLARWNDRLPQCCPSQSRNPVYFTGQDNSDVELGRPVLFIEKAVQAIMTLKASSQHNAIDSNKRRQEYQVLSLVHMPILKHTRTHTLTYTQALLVLFYKIIISTDSCNSKRRLTLA